MEACNTACILVRLVKIRGPTETLDVWQHEGITQKLTGEIWEEDSSHQQLEPLPQNISRMTVESVSSSGFLTWTQQKQQDSGSFCSAD